MNGKISVIVVDGSFLDAVDPGASVVRFDGLAWDEALNLARLGLDQGLDIVLRQEEVSEHGQEEQPVL